MVAYSVVRDGIWPKFKLIHVLMYVLVTYRNEEDQIEKLRLLSGHIKQLNLRRSRAANPVVDGRVWPKITTFKLLWLPLLPANMRKIRSKMKAQEW